MFRGIVTGAVVPQPPVLRLGSWRRLREGVGSSDGAEGGGRGPRIGAERKLRKANATVVQPGVEGARRSATLRIQQRLVMTGGLMLFRGANCSKRGREA